MTVEQPSEQPPAYAREFLTRAGLQTDDDVGRWSRLAGGVSSDLWRVELPGQTLCVKGALARLRVAAVWFAPVDRNAVEADWLAFAARHRPGNVPAVLAHDPALGLFAMTYLDPKDHPVWKTQLMAGTVRPAFAAEVGDVLGDLHAASRTEPGLAARFATDTNFEALRLEPYLRATARQHPDVAAELELLADRTAATHLALVHGDVSPKNILSGPHGPVLLDAECAWFGDPAFDVAFCLTHLALKMLAVPSQMSELLSCAQSLVTAHSVHIEWEEPSAHDLRVATLLPAILLARVDGSSPVEYLSTEQRGTVRRIALSMLRQPAASSADTLRDWQDQLAKAPVGAQ